MGKNLHDIQKAMIYNVTFIKVYLVFIYSYKNSNKAYKK